jgi:hypothetical protein
MRRWSLMSPRVDGRAVARTAVAVSDGIEAASGCYPKRAEVDKTALVARAPAARVPALWAAEARKPAAAPDVMCSTRRGDMGTCNVTSASTGLPVGSHRAGRYPGGKREHSACKNKSSHHLLRVLQARLGDSSHRIEIGVGSEARNDESFQARPDHGLWAHHIRQFENSVRKPPQILSSTGTSSGFTLERASPFTNHSRICPMPRL